MSNVKNFGLVGIGSDVQYGKVGPRIINNAGTFNFKNSTGLTDVGIAAAGIVSSSGNVTLATGNLVLTATNGTVSVGGDTILSRQQAGVFVLNGTAAVILPSGTVGQRPASPLAAMMRFNDDTDTLEYYTGTQWTTLASGGSTASLQVEIDNIETALGAAITETGIFVPSAFTGVAAGATSFTDAIQQVADATAGSLADILSPLQTGNIIYANSDTTWAVGQPGVTTGVQPYDAGLTALAVKATTGILVQTAADTYVSRSLTAPTAGFTISNNNGVAGNPTFALSNDLAALEGIATFGYAVRTTDDTWVTRSIVGTSSRIVVYNNDAVSNNTTIDLATLVNEGTGTFQKFTRDPYGRLSGTTPVVATDITGLIDSTYVSITGDTMTGTLEMSGVDVHIVLPNPPVIGTHAVNRDYVDAKISGLAWKSPVVAASTGTNVSIAAAPATLDGVTLVAGNRILLKDQTVNAENVIYIFNAAGTPLTPSPDTDTPAELVNATTFVSDGAVNGDTGWTQTGTLGSGTVQWVQFSGANTYVGGNGLTLTGNTFAVGTGPGILVGADNVSLDLFNNTVGGLILTTDGVTRSVSDASRLHLLIPASSGLVQDVTGLYIPAAGITNDKLANSAITFNGDTGSTAVSLGSALTIAGSTTQGITTTGTANTVTITAANATSAQKGVASFDVIQFVVADGNVTLGDIPLLSLPGGGTIVVAADSGPGSVLALGGTLTINGDGIITTDSTSEVVTITLGTVPPDNGGTGRTSLTAGQVLVGNGTDPVLTDPDLAFNATTNTLTVGTALLTGGVSDTSLTSTVLNSNIQLLPNGTGHVVIGSGIPGVIRSSTSQPLTIRGTTTLSLESVVGNTTMVLPVANKVTVSGPTPVQYATGLAPADLVNKQYVDTAISDAAGASGSVKNVMAIVNLSTTGTTNIGLPLPINSTILSTKVSIDTADSGTGTLSIGKAGSVAAYMTVTENDPQSLGLFQAETLVTEGTVVQIIATVAGTPVSGTSRVVVTYRLA